MSENAPVLPPTSPDLLVDSTRPYFLWWTDATVGDLKRHLASGEAAERAYWLGALLREANSRDIFLFTTKDAIRSDWALLRRHLGKKREMWAWFLDIEEGPWPPPLSAHDL